MRKGTLVSRNEIASMLKQYQPSEVFDVKASRSDIEFIKSLLLSVKAKMIQGLQTYNVKKHIDFDEYQYKFADNCIQNICTNNLPQALNWFTSIYECNCFSHIHCSYSELLVGVLLTGNMLSLSDRLLAEMDESSLLASHIYEKDLLQDAVSDIRCLSDLSSRTDHWHSYYPRVPFQEYFGLTDSEDNYVRKSLSEAFRAIAVCRKSGLSMEAYAEKIHDKISCFFSALGAPGRLNEEEFETKRRLNLHEAGKD